MFSREFRFEGSVPAGPSRRDAVDGLAAIALALDQGMEPTRNRSGRLADVLAIALGWGVLLAVIFYPALQLGAIALCCAFLGLRSFARYAFGSSDQAFARSVEDRAGLQAI